MDPEDRTTARELKAMRGTSWVAVVIAVLGFATAAGFAGLYFINHSEIQFTRKSASDAEAEYSKEIDHLTRTISRFEEEINTKRGDNDILKQQLQDQKLKTQEEKNKAKSLEDKIFDQNEQIKRLKSGNEEIIKMSAKLAENDVRIGALNEEIQRTRSILATTQSNLANATKENAKLEKELKETRVELKNTQEELASASVKSATRDVLESQLKDKEKTIDDLKEKLKKSDDELRKKDNEANTLRETIGKSGQAASELQKAMEKLSERDREIGRKETEIQGLCNQIDKLEEKNSLYDREMMTLRNALAQKGDVSEQVKALSKTLASRDEAIKKKDEEISALKEKLHISEESLTQASKSGQAEAGTLSKQLEEKNNLVKNLEKSIENLQNENKDLNSLLKSEKRSEKIVEKGEELEQVKVVNSFWHNNNEMTVRVSDGILPGNKIDLKGDLGLEMSKDSMMMEVVASARFGFLLDYQELNLRGRSVLNVDKNFYDKTFSAGDTVDSEFYIQQPGLGLIANIGAIKKTDTQRIDLGLLIGGRYLKVNTRMLDRNSGDRATENLDSPLFYTGLKLSSKYRDGVTWSVQGRFMNYKYGDFNLQNLVEGKLSFGIELTDYLEMEFGYIYSNFILERDDEDTNENFLIKLTTEGPYLGFTLTF